MDKATKKVFKSVGVFFLYAIVPAVLSWYVLGLLLFDAFATYPALIFICLAAMFNAICDCVESEFIVRTRFVGLNPKFWHKRVSWEHAKMIFKYRIDAWHLSKSAMIICFAFALVQWKPVLGWWQDVLIIGYLWNSVFNLFYNHIFRR